MMAENYRGEEEQKRRKEGRRKKVEERRGEGRKKERRANIGLYSSGMGMKTLYLRVDTSNKRSTFEVSSLHSQKAKDPGDEGKMKEKRLSHSKIKSLKTLKNLSKLGCAKKGKLLS
ncbi:hypothetical protein M9H77_09224 [Catharanthus roseus]|uniref:Uncharacterized protein n=1 Tax=Catharanthus roseus TaxID=4058 RepID=A0ACC0BZZ6_CATRO|nr:hypothetical protein M9H77_09224 [Catharanthus roseus]